MSTANIRELDGVTRYSFRCVEFRMNYPDFVQSIAFPALVILEVLVIALGAQLYEMLVLLPLMVAGLAMATALPFWWLYRYEVGPEGVVGFDRWGRRRRMKWDEITGVSAIHLFGFPYARLLAKGAPALWLPLSTDDTDGLRDCVDQHCPAGHPLLQAVRKSAV